jgi:hypothetical protein
VEFLRWRIDRAEWTVKRTDAEAAPPSLMQATDVPYTADGTPPFDRWMGS